MITIVKTKYQDNTLYIGETEEINNEVVIRNAYLCMMGNTPHGLSIGIVMVTPNHLQIPFLRFRKDEIVLIDNNGGNGFDDLYNQCKAQESGLVTPGLLKH